MGKITSFGNSKGGVGKSTLLAVVATYINNKTDLNICVIDADINQRTIARWRRDDLIDSGVKKEEAFELYENFCLHKVDYEKYDIDPDKFFDIVISDPKNIPFIIPALKDNYDLVFFDLPGNIGQEGVLTAYGYVDYLFVPTGLYVADTDATFTKYLPSIDQGLKKARSMANMEPTKVFIVLNKINKSTREYKKFVENKENMNYNFLNTVIPEAQATFGRHISTTDVISYTSQGNNIVNDLVDEILSKIDFRDKVV